MDKHCINHGAGVDGTNNINNNNNNNNNNINNNSNNLIDDKHWLWCLIIMCWLSGTGTFINGSLLFLVARIKSSFTNKNTLLLSLFLGQVVLTCVVAPFRISLIGTHDCSDNDLNTFVQSLILIPRVTTGRYFLQ